MNSIKKNKGYVSLVLHAHLPFIHHPENSDYLEEQWLFEAISETYIPLLRTFDKLVSEKINFKITMSLTPPLLNMLDNKLLKNRYIEYLNKHIELSKKEVKKNINNEKLYELSNYYFKKYSDDLIFFRDNLDCDLISNFKFFQKIGVLEIITCGATHGFLPLLFSNPNTVKAQIGIAVDCYKKFFDTNPKGIWLPECGYIPELDNYLREFKIDYIITESHGILYANPAPIYGTFAPIVSPNGLVAFGRDIESSKQVWSSINGYPGDYNYRDFYKDLGYDADYEYIKPYIASNGARVHTGIKYYKITGNTKEKDLYNIKAAHDVVFRQATHFKNSREEQIEKLSNYMENPPIILCPYDAELYGHWWYEGPEWIYELFKKIDLESSNFSLTTPSEYLCNYPNLQISTPSSSSWGANGFSEVWVNPLNDYAHRHLYNIGAKMIELVNRFPKTAHTSLLIQRAITQCGRELLLLQSSDWLFILTNKTMVEYANKRIKEHTGRFLNLYNQIFNNNIDIQFLEYIENIDCIFPELNYMHWK
ncbi:MAG TPA: DUF1957 domain-containing protein [Clostridia bacterium]|nr:DUF1957 domain-containing protein [Clostridia bacterium]